MPKPTLASALSSGYMARFSQAKVRLQLAEEALGQRELLFCDHHLALALAQIRIMRQWLSQGLAQEPLP